MSAVKLVEEHDVHRITIEFQAEAVRKVDASGPYGNTRISFFGWQEVTTQIPVATVRRKIAAAKKKGNAA